MKKNYALFLLALFFTSAVFSQVNGDYRTNDGSFSDWSDAIWEKYVSGAWDDNGGGLYNGPATIPSGNTCTILSGGAVVIGGSVTNNGSIVISDQLYLFGGTLTNNGTVTNSGTFQLATGTYIHNQNGGSLPASAQWDDGSTLEFRNVTTTKPSNFPASVGSLIINCSGLSSPFTLEEGFEVKTDLTITNTGSSVLRIIAGGGSSVLVKGDLSVASGGKLEISADAALSVEGTTSNATDANFVIKSTSAGTGSFICDSGTPHATSELYVSKGAWHLIGPPVSTAPATTFYTGYMQRWHEYSAVDDAGYWEVIENNPTLTRGYGDAFYFISSNYTASFTGQLVGAKVTVGSLGNTTNDGTDGWHCLANPFPSAIDWGTCTATNVSNAEVYNGSSYVVKSILASMQGFMVQVDDNKTGSVDFEIAAKTHDNTGIVKSSNSLVPHLIFDFSDELGLSKDQLIIQLSDEATFGYESEFDARKIMGNPKAGEIFAGINDDDYACMLGIPFPTTNYTVPIGFRLGDASEYTFSLRENTLPNQMSCLLKDTETGQVVDLKTQKNYSFSAEGSNFNRFELLLSNATGIQTFDNNSKVRIWGDRGDVTVQTLDNSYDIRVYNMEGKMIDSYSSLQDELFHFTIRAPKGVYIVEYQSTNASFSKKIIK